MKKLISILFSALIFVPIISTAGPIDILNKSLQVAIAGAATTLQTTAILWLSSFILIQFLITNIGLLKSGADFEAIFAKFIGSIVWFGFCFYVMANGVSFIDKVTRGFFTMAGEISGAGRFDAGGIIEQGAVLAGNLLASINNASGITDLFMPSLLGGLLGLVILATAALIAFKVFLIKIESAIIIMMAPLSFSFLGLNALKDQGIAPFKSLLSLLYRVVLIALILKAMDGMSDNLASVIDEITSDSISGIWSVLFAAVLGYVLLGFLVFKSDSIAANLASGTTNMGTGDVASAAAMGAAMGAVVATGGAAAAGAAAKVPESMGSFMGGLGGGGGAVSNASGRGAGQTPSQAPSRAASMSTASGGAGASSSSGSASAATPMSGPPVRPANTGAGSPSAAPSASGRAESSGAAPSTSGSAESSGAAPSTSGSAESPGAAPSASGSAESSGAMPSASGSAESLSAVGRSDAKSTGLAANDRTPPQASGGAPVRPGASDRAAGNAPPTRPGSGGEAAISGDGTGLEKQIGDLVTALGKSKEPTFGDRAKDLGRHIEQEKAPTHVSINTHNSD